MRINLSLVRIGILSLACLAAAPATADENVMVVFDGSNSMWGQIDGTAKIEIARETAAEHIFLERDRCIFCQRCVEHVRDAETGQAIFAIHGRGTTARIEMDVALADKLTPEQVRAAADLCPVGCILQKGVGFDDPMGQRKFEVKSLRKRVLEGESS